MSTFSRGKAPERPSLALMNLPEPEKRELAAALLDEFGVRHVRRTDAGEMIHSCCIPNAGHANGDRNASASLNWQKLTYNCFGCGSSGGILWFIATCRGLDTEEARGWLGTRTGLGQTTMDLSELIDVITRIYAKPEAPAPIPSYAPSVLDPWTDWDAPHPYLTETGVIPGTRIYGRAVPVETIERFRVGYCDQYFDGSERIIIPLFWRDKLVGWQARALDPELPDKYRNSPDFPRERVLFNHRPDLDVAVVVESPMSVLRRAHHIPQMTATFGAKVTEAQARHLQVHERVILWFDNDAAGWNATRTVGDLLQRHTRVSVVDSPWAADPADFDDTTAEDLLTRTVPYSVWAEPQQLIKWKRR